MADTHDAKSHDYASNSSPYGNYHFAGEMALLFAHSSKDAGFVGRLAEKIYRLANLEKSGKVAKNESIDDTERDIAVITALWMASRRESRGPQAIKLTEEKLRELNQFWKLNPHMKPTEAPYCCAVCHTPMYANDRKLVLRFRNMITHTAYLCSDECERSFAGL